MKLTIGLLLLCFVALTSAQLYCLTDHDCAAHCFLHVGQCRDGICHCVHVPVDVGRRQTCTEGHACTCADGTAGHCDHLGVCHCHH